jgi:hypothetical protein
MLTSEDSQANADLSFKSARPVHSQRCREVDALKLPFRNRASVADILFLDRSRNSLVLC